MRVAGVMGGMVLQQSFQLYGCSPCRPAVLSLLHMLTPPLAGLGMLSNKHAGAAPAVADVFV
jgi:hypothetical protein